MKLLIQLIFIFTSFSFIGLFAALRFTVPESLLNQELRPTLLKSSLARHIFRLTRLGDGRYILSVQNPLTINLYYPPAFVPNPELQTWLTEAIQPTTSHLISLKQYKLSTIPNQPLSDTAIDDLVKTLPKTSENTLNLIYLHSSKKAPSNAGQAINANTIIMFYDVIQSLSAQTHIRNMIEQSTLMHEWGHILNLGHIDQEDCIMNEKVEVYENRRFQGTNLPIIYCPEEIYQLKNQIK